MSTPGLSPASPESHAGAFSAKRLFIKAAGFGAGFALILAILSVVSVWYWNRPKPPKPWDTTSIKATFYRVQRVQENNDWRLDFEFVLENTTSKDFELQKYSNYRLAAKLGDTDSLTGFADNFQLVLKLPVFVPAHQKTRVDIVLPDYDVDVKTPLNSNNEEWHKYYEDVEHAVSEKMTNLNGFSLFDENLRYQINLPNGWAKSKN